MSEVSGHVHLDHPEHNISMDDPKILEVEPKWSERGAKKATHIWTIQPSLNKDRGGETIQYWECAPIY